MLKVGFRNWDKFNGHLWLFGQITRVGERWTQLENGFQNAKQKHYKTTIFRQL